MKKFFIIAASVLVISAAVWYFFFSTEESSNQYIFVKVEKGDLVSVVSSTGTLNAVTTVQVGTQVSGIVSKIFADFNTQVKKGQLIALIDTTFLAASVREAEASVERANAQLFQAQREYERTKSLTDKSLGSETELDQAKYNLALANSQLKSAKSSMERAQINLKYAQIRAPIDGTVIARNVDVGQTVAASFSAPVIFLIANDLTKMQILANVDESDIGLIEQGQDVKFTVQAQPDKKFKGNVSQIRLQPTTIQNVVNYTVVIDVSNDRGLLLPGMTATIEFITEKSTDIIKVANAATRIRPTVEMQEIMKKAMEERMKNLPDSIKQKFATRQPGQGGTTNWSSTGGGGFGGAGMNGGSGQRKSALLWVKDESNQFKPIRVRLGITDGQMTEVISEDINEGMEVLSQIILSEAAKNATTSTSPFQNNSQQQQPGGGRRGF